MPTYKVEEVGIFQLRQVPAPELVAGQVGYLIAGIKTISDTRCGDTITLKERPCAEPLPGFKEAKPVVFSSIYPMAADDYEELATAIEKLKLNDAAIVYEKDSSAALGFGFRCGFLGLLHLEVVQERLEREYGLSLILTAPSVRYQIKLRDGSEIAIDNPALYPDPTRIESTAEPFIRATIIVPERYMGAVMKLCLERRGANTNYQYLTSDRLEMIFELPLADVVYDFYDKLKSITQGYGSFDYELLDYRETDLVKLDILINGERVDALSQLVHRDNAVLARPHGLREDQGGDPAPTLQNRHPGRDRRQRHLPRDRLSPAQGCARQVLRRRHHPQAQAARKAEEGQKAHEDGRQSHDPAVRVPGGAENGQRLEIIQSP